MEFRNKKDLTAWKMSDSIVDEYVNELLKMMQLNSLDDFFNLGVSISEVENNYNKAISDTLILRHNVIAKFTKGGMSKIFPCRKILKNIICSKFGSVNNYMHTKACVDRRVKRIGDTMETKYGYRNPGQSPEHKEKMKKGVRCENPFSTEKFSLLEYIKGKRCLPEQRAEFTDYYNAVWSLTQKNRQFVEFTGKCYYTGQQIFKCNQDNNIDRNSWNSACLDHKISILYGFLHNISPGIIGSIDNLCWTSRFFNSSIKKDLCESQLISLGIVQRYIECLERFEDSNECSNSEENQK